MTETEKNHSFQRVQLMKQAAVIRQNNGMNRHDALVTAHRIGKLIRQMHHGNVCFRYTKQDGSDMPPAPSPDMNIVSTVRIYPNRKIRSLSTMISKPKAGAPFTLKIFWISKWNESTGKKDESARTKRVGSSLQTV